MLGISLELARIISGFSRCHIKEGLFLIGPPSFDHLYLAEEIYQQIIEDTKYDDLVTDEEIVQHLKKNLLWDDSKHTKLVTLKKDLEELKLKLYTLSLQTFQQNQVRVTIKECKKQIDDLESVLHNYDYVTREGLATYFKTKFVFGISIYDSKKNNYWADPLKDYGKSDNIYEKLFNRFGSSLRLSEPEYRNIALCDEWQHTYSIYKDKIFRNVPLSIDQRYLLMWTQVYDGCRQHPECPHDSIMRDHDMFDGWMILQKRNRDESLKKAQIESKINNPKISGADEIYVPADTKEDATTINSINTPQNKLIKKRREAMLNRAGVLKEQELPDVAMNIMSEAHAKGIKVMDSLRK